MPHTKVIKMPRWLTKTLGWCLIVIYLYLPIHAFVSTWGGTAIGPLWLWKSWKEILLAVLTVVTIGWIVSVPGLLKKLVREPVIVVVIGYVTLTIMHAVYFYPQNGADATFAGLGMNLRYLAISTLTYLLFRYGQVSPRWISRGIWAVVWVGVSLAVVGILQILVIPADFLSLFGYEKGVTIAPSSIIDDRHELLRAFATLRGPNDFGAYLILPLVVTIAYMKRLPIWVVSSTVAFLAWGILASGSRSAWLGAAVAVVAYLLSVANRKLSPKMFIIGGMGGLVVLAIVGYVSVTVPQVRQAVFHSSPGDSSLTEGSTDKHISATLGGLERVGKDPLGCGPGCAGPASYYSENPKISENYFIQIAEETGWFGIAMFMVVVVSVAIKLLNGVKQHTVSRILLATLLGHGAIALMLHVWSDDPVSMTFWLLTGAVIGYNDSQKWIKSKVSSRSKTWFSS